MHSDFSVLAFCEVIVENVYNFLVGYEPRQIL
jgi:hypothetical protein